MKKLYVTYIENGIIKKGEITESRYSELSKNINVTDLVCYPSNLLMEQNYSIKQSGTTDQKKILHG